MSGLAQVQAEDLNGFVGMRLIRVRGEIDLSNSHEVLDSITARVPSESARVVLDLSSTTYLDSSGIAMIFQLAERLRTSRTELRLVVPEASPIRVAIDLTAVGKVVAVDAFVSDAAQGQPD